MQPQSKDANDQAIRKSLLNGGKSLATKKAAREYWKALRARGWAHAHSEQDRHFLTWGDGEAVMEFKLQSGAFVIELTKVELPKEQPVRRPQPRDAKGRFMRVEG